MRANGSRIGKTETLAQPFVEACFIEGSEDEPALFAADESERPIIR
jgi:hypothetical protein